MASKKKKSDVSNVEITALVPVTGAWVAVIDAERGFEVVVWALTPLGVLGLVSVPGNASLVVPEGCIGYVQRDDEESVENACARYFDDNFVGPDEGEGDSIG